MEHYPFPEFKVNHSGDFSMKRITFLALIFATVLIFIPAMNCAAQDREDACVNDTSWKITANGAPSGAWDFHRDGEVLGIYPAGVVAWRSRWRQISHNRYVYEFDYQRFHYVQYVQFTDDCNRLLGYSDPDMRDQNREGIRLQDREGTHSQDREGTHSH
jgi:hypothetical protein